MVAKGQEIEFKALEGSLNMMSKVLNDVLDFNRMDSGRFESVLKPYAFHKVMRSLMIPLRLATDSRGLQFITDLDKSIDDAARTALYDSMELPEHEIAKRMSLDEDGIVVGDETRLRQIVTNLARYAGQPNLRYKSLFTEPSNACKFTPTGGRLMVTTRLLRPGRAPQSDAGSVTEVQRNSPSRPQTPVNGHGKTPESEFGFCNSHSCSQLHSHDRERRGRRRPIPAFRLVSIAAQRYALQTGPASRFHRRTNRGHRYRLRHTTEGHDSEQAILYA